MPRLSLVITCREEGELFEQTLVSALQHRPADCEVIVVHPFAYTDPYSLGGEVRLLTADGEASWARLANTGIGAATGRLVHVLREGLIVTDEDWFEPALQRFDDPRVAAVAPLVVSATGTQSRIELAGVRWSLGGRRQQPYRGKRWREGKTLRHPMAPGLAAAFYRREVFEQLGGLDESLSDPVCELDFGLSLAALGLRTELAPECRLQGELPMDSPAGSFQNGRSLERAFWRHRQQRSLLGSLLLHPCAVLADAFDTLASGGLLGHVLGRLAASCERANYRLQQQRIEKAVAVQQQGPRLMLEPTTVTSLTADQRRAA